MGRRIDDIWRPPRWVSWIALVGCVAWALAMIFWIRAGWGLWLLPLAGALLLCLAGIVSPRRRDLPGATPTPSA